MSAVNHMVIVKLKLSVSEEVVSAVMQSLVDLKQSCPGIRSISHGKYSSPEGLNKGFDYGFNVVFESMEDRNIYLDHPSHENVKNALIAIIDDVVAFDYVI